MLDFHASAVSLTGADELIRKLEALAGPKIAKKATKAAVRKGAAEIRKEMKRRAPATKLPHKIASGKIVHRRLKKSIGTKVKWYSNTKTALAIIGPRLGKYGGYHAHLLEYGTAPRYHDPSEMKVGVKLGRTGRQRLLALAGALGVKGKYVGIGPKKPFARPAFDAKKRDALRIIHHTLAAKIQEVAKAKG
ncbi:MAG: HK97 gp10 family phage protein [Phycisphaerae bacterium]|nr:HK97 gp10 family phage protein [Phycisphaerae bacterium]